VIGLTGERDLVRDASRLATIANGHPLMARVTAMGCAAPRWSAPRSRSSRRLEGDRRSADHHRRLWRMAAARARGPGSFAVEILDAMYALDRDTLIARAKVS
jgi:hydroxyethylthiazole kinase